MAKFYLIGGHDFDLKSNYIQSELISLSNKDKPKILLFPTASFDSDKTINNFKKEFENLNYDLDIVYLYKSPNINEIKDKILTSDIIYFTGGNTKKFYEFLTNSGYDELLYFMAKIDKIIAGTSAGAIIFCKYGLGDSESYYDNGQYYNYKKVLGLGILDIAFCPHFNLGDRILYFKDILTEIDIAYALSNDTALLIDEDNVIFFKVNNKFNIYKFEKEKDYMMEKL